MISKEHRELMGAFNRLIKQDRWTKAPKKKGKVLEKSFTKVGNIKFVVNTGRNNFTVYILKRNKNIFEAAAGLTKGDYISVTLRTHLGKNYCIKLTSKKERKLDEFM